MKTQNNVIVSVSREWNVSRMQTVAPSDRVYAARSCRGFTLLELIIVVAIIGILASIAMPLYAEIRAKATVSRAIGEIRNLETEINAYFTEKENLPVNITDLGRGDILDPWGRKYEYQLIATAGGAERKLFGISLNTGYDLYSKGKDGQSAPSLADPKSKDDVVLANDGGYVGLGESY
jgi:general secretion pathway protein G